VNGRDGASSPPLPAWLAVVLVVATSAAVLVLEILAGRLLAPYVGVSLDTYTGIIGTILVGIALGAWAGGFLADRVDPHRLLPVLLVLGGALALATIPVVRALGSAGGGGSGPRILFLTAVGFLPSATVLSAVPPAVVKLQLRDLGATGVTVGRLSAYGTGGAIVGTFLTGFVLVAWAAVTTLIVAVGIVLVVGGLALAAFSIRRGRGPATRSLGGATGLGALALVGLVAVEAPCDVQTAYYCASVVVDPDRPTGRVLVLDDPTHLEFWYVRRLADAIDVAVPSGPVDVLHVGGGGLTLPRAVRATRPPGSEQVVLEIDGDLVDLVTDELGAGPDLDVRVGDARLAVDDLPDASFDVVVGDAFGGRAVPWHLTTREFADDVARVLRPDGVYAINIIDGTRQGFLRAEAATLLEVFERVVVLLGPGAAGGGRGNSVIVATNGPLDTGLVGRLAERDGGRSLVEPGAVEEFVAGARALTDDFAPVDQLLGGGA
jgi:hypothetical protein